MGLALPLTGEKPRDGPWNPAKPSHIQFVAQVCLLLTVIIPVFNEAKTLPQVLCDVSRALPGVPKQIIVVDDASLDGTAEWLRSNLPDDTVSGSALSLTGDGRLLTEDGPVEVTVQVVHQPRNRGKGAAVRTGLNRGTAEVFVIQDADQEYDPADWAPMYDLIARRRVADVVYGSRFSGATGRSLRFHHYFANRLISRLFSLLYDQNLRDIETCYKMFTRAVKDSLILTADDFGVEVQISAQIALARRWRIYETSINYYGRTHADGKKIGWQDGVKALWCLLRFRLRPF